MAEIYTVCKTTAELTDDPKNGLKVGRRDSQLLFGEQFEVIRSDGEWIYGTSLADGYRGYVHTKDLLKGGQTADRVVDVALTHIYSAPDFKTRPIMALSFMSRLAVEPSDAQNGFIKISQGWIFENHTAPLSKPATIVEKVFQFLKAPYLYGGRSALGIDCSALVQLSLLRCGIPCPRDADQQAESVGTSVEQKNLRHGDLVFFKGHVGIMMDSDNILNATARTMDVRVEPLSVLTDFYKGIISVRRL